MMRFWFILMMTAVFLTGCQTDESEKFIGSWENIRNKAEELAINRNGENYVVSVRTTLCNPKATKYDRNAPKTEPELDCEQKEEKFPATYGGDKLTIKVGAQTLDILIEKTSGHLLAKGEQFKKISNTN